MKNAVNQDKSRRNPKGLGVTKGDHGGSFQVEKGCTLPSWSLQEFVLRVHRSELVSSKVKALMFISTTKQF